MELLHALYTRQSMGKVRPDPVPRELVEQILDAAATAPNHRRLRPWRFVVLTGDARLRLGDLMAQSLINRNAGVNTELLESERKKPLRAPVVVAVGVDKPGLVKITEIENICACAAAVENMLLAAHALGLAAIWKTGGAVDDVDIKSFLGFEADQPLIAFVYMGYPDVESERRERPERPLAADRTRWLED